MSIAPPHPLRAGVYGRQSAGKAKSIAEQIAECTDDAQAEGWTVAQTYQDGSSASRYARTARTDWARVLADVDAGVLDVLVLWESSRGDRNLTTWSALLDLCRERGVWIRITSDERTYNLRNDTDWRVLAGAGVDAAHESAKVSKRVRRSQPGAARAGNPSHGRTPYGYTRTRELVTDPDTGKRRTVVRQHEDPATAPVVREIFARLGKSEPVSRIVADLNDRGVPTLTARAWYRARVRDMATNRAYAGERVYNGQTFPGEWPALVEPTQFYAVQRVLTADGRTTTRPGRQKHLLSYLGTCAVCSAPLCVVRGRYRCLDNGCVTIVQAEADEFVRDAVLGWLARKDVHAKLRRLSVSSDRAALDARNEVATLRGRLADWRASAARGKTTPASLAAIEADLTAQIEAAQQRADSAAVPPALRQLLAPGADVRARWEAATLPARRTAIKALAVIVVRPAAVPGDRRFDFGRLGASRWMGDTVTWGEHWAAASTVD